MLKTKSETLIQVAPVYCNMAQATCPKCGNTMTRVNLGSGLYSAACRRCGEHIGNDW